MTGKKSGNLSRARECDVPESYPMRGTDEGANGQLEVSRKSRVSSGEDPSDRVEVRSSPEKNIQKYREKVVSLIVSNIHM